MPLFHIHGLVGAVLSSLWSGGSVACAPDFQAPRFLYWLEELAPTWYTAVPTTHQAVLARVRAEGAPGGRSRLRLVRSSSAPLPTPVLHALEEAFGVPVIESYGMTEAAHQMTSNPLPPGERKPGSVGPAAGPEVAILDEDGAVLPAGSTGEVAIRGDNVFSGYGNNPEANETAFSNGWFRTGDEGHLDEDGFLFLHGRAREIINRGGEKISPREVDEVLLAHPAVAQAVAFSVPDRRLGDEVGAAVVLRPGRSVTERELQQFAGERLADFKVPRHLAVVDEIPMGTTGKLQRIGLAERLGLGETKRPSAASAEPRTELERELAQLWREILDVERVGADDDFFALGGDSILAVELIATLRVRYGRPRLPLTTLVWAPTVTQLAAELAGDEEDAPLSHAVPVRREGTARRSSSCTGSTARSSASGRSPTASVPTSRSTRSAPAASTGRTSPTRASRRWCPTTSTPSGPSSRTGLITWAASAWVPPSPSRWRSGSTPPARRLGSLLSSTRG